MKIKSVLILTCIVLSMASLSIAGKENNQKDGKFFLWKISHHSNHGYILGSIHFLKKDMYPLPRQVEKAFEESEILAVEADISDAKMAQHFKLTMEKGMYSGDDTLKANISKKTFLLAEKILKEKGVDIILYQKFKPWFLALTISGMELMKMGFNPSYGVDKYFIDKASKGGFIRASKKEIVELEGIEFQINLFDSLTKAEMDSFLFYTLLEISSYSTDLNPMVSAWAKGNVSKMEELVTKSIYKYKKLSHIYKKLVDERNFQMVDKIVLYLNSNKIYFVVVGAAHLVGKNGIVQLLINKGFQLKQM